MTLPGRLSRVRGFVLPILALLATGELAGGPEGSAWPQFRGAGARGVAEGHPTPTRWDVPAGENVKWKTAIPGLGHSSPVVWGDRVFVTTAISGKASAELKVGLYGDIDPVEDDTVHRFEVYAVDVRDGKLLWKRAAAEGTPKIKRHTKASHANSTPATDGKHVVALFGSEGLHVYDVEGKPLWKKDLGVLDAGYFRAPSAQWGFGSSPIIHDGRVIVQADVQEGSFLAAFDLRDGSEVWRTPREDVPTWGTPTVHASDARTQIVVNGWKHAGGYDAATGEELWSMEGGGDIPVPTPYVAHDLIFLTSAHGGPRPVWAIRTSARGEITLEDGREANEHIAWSDTRGGSYIPTSLVYGELLYVLRDNGILSCRRAETGEVVYQERIGAGTAYTASPVAADGKIYLTAETGEVRVVRAGPRYELLATNPLGEIAMATPAISRGVLYFRTRDHLVAVTGRPARRPPAEGGHASPARGHGDR